MVGKLAIRNVKKNTQTYSVYFGTLVLIYSLLYSFNAVVNNPVLQTNSDTISIIATFMEWTMGAFSILVSIGFVFLVLYTTQFIIKRRSKELGLYSSLGMRNDKISRILFLENLLVNIVSLICGLLLGLILSAGLTKLMVRIFYLTGEVNLFYISEKSLKTTISCFLIIVVISAVFNKFKLRQLSIVSLLTEEISSDKYEERNPKLDTIKMIISIVSLFVAAYLLKNADDLNMLKNRFIPIIGLFAIGIIGFYTVLSNVLISIFKKSRFYYKSCNSIWVRDLSSESKKNSTTIAVISMFLSLSFSIVLVGGSSYISMNEAIKESSPYNLTILTDKELNKDKIEEELIEIGVDPDEQFEKYLSFNLYESDIKYSDIGIDKGKLWSLDQGLDSLSVQIISLSDYNKVLSMQGKDEISLADDEYLINCNYKGTRDMIEAFLSKKESLKVGNKVLQSAADTSLTNIIIMTSVGNNDRGTLILADSAIKDLNVAASEFNAIYKEGVDEAEMTAKMDDWVMDNSWQEESGLKFTYKYQTKDRLIDMYAGYMGVIIFLASFVGIVFTIMALCMLSIQSTTNAINFKKDSVILSSLGLKRKKIFNILFLEVIIYFIIPCIIAIPAGVVVGSKIIEFFELFLNFAIDLHPMVFVLQLVLFIGYILMTFGLSRRIVVDD